MSLSRGATAVCCGFAGYMAVPLLVFGCFPGGGLGLRLLLPAALGIAAMVAVFVGGEPPGRLGDKLGIGRVELKPLLGTAGLTLLMTLAIGLATTAFQAVLEYLKIRFDQRQALVDIASGADAATWLLIALAVCVLVPVAEELLFRRAVFGVLLPLGEARALIATSLIFSLCHGFLLGVPGLFLLGLGFQYLYRRYRNIAYPVFSHAMFNFITLCAALLTPSGG